MYSGSFGTTPGYLATLGARLVRRRMFDESDFDRTTPAVLLSESAAKHFRRPRTWWERRFRPSRRRRLRGGRGPKPEVVGIVGDIKYTGLDSPSSGSIYVLWPFRRIAYLVVRADGDQRALAASLRRLVREIDPMLPVPDVKSLEDEVLASIADRRLRLVPAISFGILALLVALVGLSAAMTRAVHDRQRELAIRSALGASPARTRRMILTEGALVSAARDRARPRRSRAGFQPCLSTFSQKCEGLEWGRLYEEYHGKSYDPKKMSDDVKRLAADDVRDESQRNL